MDNPKITVIIPVYNTADYLEECINSVVNQSFNEFEIICVNDGSTDSSLDILESYKSKDSRITIINQPNMGLGAARNVALKCAKGDYILFLDSDDYIAEEMLSDVYNLVQQKSLDLLFFKLINFDNDTRAESKANYFEMKFLNKMVGSTVFNWKDVKDRLFDLSVTAPGKLFKRDLIKDMEFPEDLIFEDTLFFMETFFKVKRAYFYDKHFYFRRIRSDSIMNSYYKNFPDCIPIYDRIGDYLKHVKLYDDFAVQLFDRKCKDIFTRFCKVPDDFKEEFYTIIKQNFSEFETSLLSEGTLESCNERSNVIFYSAVNSDSYREFELLVESFDLRKYCDRLKSENDKSEKRYEHKISELTSENEKYQREINVLKNSTSWKVTRIFRIVMRYFKK